MEPHFHFGVVSVDFIERVSHGSGEAPGQAEARPLSAKVLGPAKPPGASQPSPDGTSAATGAAGGARPGQIENESAAFLALITKLINQRKIYPRQALDREEEGKVMIAITLGRGGDVVSLEIEAPSPFESLNAAAVRTVNSIGAFPAVPAGIPVPLHLHVPLVFRISHD